MKRSLCLTLYVWGIEVLAGFWWGNLKESDHLEDLDVGGRIWWILNRLESADWIAVV